jgi:hypothetical protein
MENKLGDSIKMDHGTKECWEVNWIVFDEHKIQLWASVNTMNQKFHYIKFVCMLNNQLLVRENSKSWS